MRLVMTRCDVNVTSLSEGSRVKHGGTVIVVHPHVGKVGSHLTLNVGSVWIWKRRASTERRGQGSVSHRHSSVSDYRSGICELSVAAGSASGTSRCCGLNDGVSAAGS